MSLRAEDRRLKLTRLVLLVLVGIGLIALGFVVPHLLLSGDQGTHDFSVVPSGVSFPAPDLTLNDLHSQKVSLADFRPQIVLVNNWATWCPPCKLEMPALQKYFEEHAQEGYALIAIEAGDSIEDVTEFVNEYKLTFPVLLDPNEKSLIAFHNDSLPSSYVINHEGTVVLAWTGPISYAMLEKYLTPLLEK